MPKTRELCLPAPGKHKLTSKTSMVDYLTLTFWRSHDYQDRSIYFPAQN